MHAATAGDLAGGCCISSQSRRSPPLTCCHLDFEIKLATRAPGPPRAGPYACPGRTLIPGGRSGEQVGRDLLAEHGTPGQGQIGDIGTPADVGCDLSLEWRIDEVH